MSNTAAFDWAGVVNYAKRRVGEAPKTQYELPGVNVENHCDVPVACVPLWHSVVTARLSIQKGDKAALKQAKERLDKALAAIEAIYPLYPDGILIQVAYGLPYFREFVPKTVADKFMPRAIENGKPGGWAITDAIKYPKDPAHLVLEQNDISFHFKSDYADHISEVMRVPRGYQILRLESRSATKIRTYDEARDDISRKVAQNKSQGELMKYLERLRAEATIVWRNDELKKAYDLALQKREKELAAQQGA